MIPYQGLVANILTVIVLIKLWDSPATLLWRTIAGLAVLDIINVRIFLNTVRECGENDRRSNFALLVGAVTQTAIIGLCIYALIKY